MTHLISTKINFEITEYHEKIFAGLSIRQLVCFGIAIVLAVATFAVGIYYFGATADTLSYIVMIEVMPFLGVGFIKRNGYPFEKLVSIYWRNMTESHQIPVRPFKECYNDSQKKSRKGKPCECQAASSLTKKEIKSRTAQARKSIARAKKDTRKEQRTIRKANKEKARAAKGQ
ncbi:MAG: PrgI family protein [Blautia massiliensis (ex Durand et al. 2017)]